MASQSEILKLIGEIGGNVRLRDLIKLANSQGMDIGGNHIAQRVESLCRWGQITKVSLGVYALTGTSKESRSNRGGTSRSSASSAMRRGRAR